MNRSKRYAAMVRIILTVLVAAWCGSSANAQNTSLTYQGRLLSAGNPASGLHDMRFRLFDAATVGNPIGSQMCVNNIAVTDGLFTVQVDFGQQYATTALRFLEIEIRPDTGLTCSNTTGFVTLAPRQQLTAAPLAAHAHAAFALDAPDGSPTSALIVNDAGYIGIGTPLPLGPLDVRSGGSSMVRIDAANGDLHVNGGTDGFFGIYNDGVAGGRTEFISNVSTVNMGIANTGGWVGIGTSPIVGTKLAVAGNIKLGTTAQYYAPAGEENLRIIRGVVDAAGNIIVGSGFTAVHDAPTGFYHITFNTAFSGPPAVTMTVDASGQTFGFGMTDGVSAGQMELIIRQHDGHFMDAPFHFIAVGPR